MSALSTLGNVVAQKTGLPAQAAAMPGDQTKMAIPQANPALSNIAQAAGKTIPQTTPTTPIGGQAGNIPGNVPGTIANTVKQTVSGINNANNANPQLIQQEAGAAVTYYQNQKATADATKQKADKEITTLQPAYTKAQQDVASLTMSTADNPGGDYEVAWSYDPNSSHSYNPQTDGAPQLLLNVHVQDDKWMGTVYTLQADGSYAPQQVSLSNNDLYKLYHGKTAVFASTPKAVNAFKQLAATGTQLKNAQATSTQAAAQSSAADASLQQQQARLSQVTNQIAQNQNVSGLGQSLAAIGGGFNSAYQTDVDQANQAKTALVQQSGLGTVANSGAARTANAFGVANINQTNAQALDVQHASLVDQQAQQVGTALQSALASASSQTGLQLQTMQQDLTAAIQSLQNDLQFASGEQQVAIQNYINALQNEQGRLRNAIGGGAVTDQEVTQIGSSVASGVASAAAIYTASAKKNGGSAS